MVNENLELSEFQVLKSRSGFYVGKMCRDLDSEYPELWMPYNRKSQYFLTYAEAEDELSFLKLKWGKDETNDTNKPSRLEDN